jgi:hypothetical protein
VVGLPGGKSMIEKLGITPGPWDGRSYSAGNVENIQRGNKTICSFVAKNNVSIIATAPEMLEALIYNTFDSEFALDALKEGNLSYVESALKRINHRSNDCSCDAIDKTMEEVKAIIKEE